MAEEADAEVLERPAEAVVADAPQDSEEAQRVARLMGWRSEDEFKDGDRKPKEFLSATDFLKLQPDIARSTRERAKGLEGKLNRVVAQVAKLQGMARTAAEADRNERLRVAVESGKLEDAKAILAEAQEDHADAPAEPPAFSDFKARNDWFGVDDEATDYVRMLDRKLAREAGGADKVTDPEAHFRKIEAGVKKRFPELFKAAEGERSERKDPPPLGRGGRANGGGARQPLTVQTMTSDMRRAARDTGVSEERYVKSWNAMQEAASAR